MVVIRWNIIHEDFVRNGEEKKDSYSRILWFREGDEESCCEAEDKRWTN